MAPRSWCLLVLAAAGCARPHAPVTPPPATEVTVVRPIKRVIPDTAQYTGRVDAKYLVEVRARVSGYLTKVNFADGTFVKKDQVLYEIDPRPYQAELNKAKGEVERLEGAKQLADIQVQRYTRLVAKGAASQQDLDEWRGKQAENVGAIAAAKSQVDYAKLNLDFCTISSPIDGLIGRTLWQIGNLVAPDQTVLTTIVSLDPIYVYFSMDEPTYLKIIKDVRSGDLPYASRDAIPVDVGLADDVTHQFPFKGLFNFSNNVVDKLTATITIRGELHNPFDIPGGKPPLLKPGMFARVRINTGKPKERLIVPERAVGTDQGHKFLWVVDSQDKSHQKRVRLGQELDDGLRVVEDGLGPDDRVVVSGLQRCRPGQEVKPQEADDAPKAAPAAAVGK